MQWRARRDQFRAILSGNKCIHPASVFDPLSARIAEHLGFEFAMMAGSTASLTVLGAPDLVLLTATEFAQQAQRVCRAMSLPLLVDADHGYGNALNVARTIEELATVGVAAATIEDTILPVPFGANGNAGLISLEEGVGKMRAALAARPDQAFAVIGRTSAPVISNIDDTVARLTRLRKSRRRCALYRRTEKPGGSCCRRRRDKIAADPRQCRRRPRRRRSCSPARANFAAGPRTDHGRSASRLRYDESAARRHQPRPAQECSV